MPTGMNYSRSGGGYEPRSDVGQRGPREVQRSRSRDRGGRDGGGGRRARSRTPPHYGASAAAVNPASRHRGSGSDRSGSRNYRRSWGKGRDDGPRINTGGLEDYHTRRGGYVESRRSRRSGERHHWGGGGRYYYKKGYKSRSLRRRANWSSDYGGRSPRHFASLAEDAAMSRRRSTSRSRERRVGGGGGGGYYTNSGRAAGNGEAVVAPYDHHHYYPPREEGGGGGGRRKRSAEAPSSSGAAVAAAALSRSGRSEGGSGGDSGGSSRDDTIGHYEGKPGAVIGDRYQMVQEVGVGTFGRVLECIDRKRSRRVAIKMVRNLKKYTESARIEAEILVDVRKQQSRLGVSHIVELFGTFEFQGHCCLVFEKLGVSLYDYLKKHDFVPYPMGHVREFARQLLLSLVFLRSMNLIHTDLKPENILLCTNEVIRKNDAQGDPIEIPASTDVKVIDFGGATYDDDNHKSTIVNTRQYRAPEVILEVGWSFASDIWSAGCIIAELYTGDLLFATHDNMEHLALMERSISAFPSSMLHKSKVASKFFDSQGRSRWRQALDKDGQKHVRRMKRLEEIFEADARTGITDVIKGLLTINPKERLTAEQALALPFFKESSALHSSKNGSGGSSSTSSGSSSSRRR